MDFAQSALSACAATVLSCMKSCLNRFTSTLAVVALVFAALLVAASFKSSPTTPGPARSESLYADWHLYRDITARVQAGGDYYRSAASEQRAHDYPTSPWPAFRLPTAAVFLSALRTDAARTATLLILVATTAIALRQALNQTVLSVRQKLLAAALMTTGLAPAGAPHAIYMHEIWAGALVALSLACQRPNRFAVSVALGLCACLIRETSAPYLAVMLCCSALQRRRSETFAWAAAIALFGVFLGVHIALALPQHLPGDLVRGGWVRFGGWSFVLLTARDNALLWHAPQWAIGAYVVLAVIGLLSVRDWWSARVAATACIFLAAFACVGRPDNYYWGFLYAPLLPLGLVYAASAVRGLAVNAAQAFRLPAKA